MAKKVKIPKTLGGCADRLYKLKGEKAELTKKIAKLDEEFKAIKAHLIDTLPKSKAEGITGKQARAKVVTKEIPSVNDWPKLYKYITRTKSFELLQRRVSDAAVKERWEAGKKVPGVDIFTAVTVSVTKK